MHKVAGYISGEKRHVQRRLFIVPYDGVVGSDQHGSLHVAGVCNCLVLVQAAVCSFCTASTVLVYTSWLQYPLALVCLPKFEDSNDTPSD